jgi:hypothetical protein
MRLMRFPKLFRRKLPTVFVVHSRSKCDHPSDDRCWACVHDFPFWVEVYRRRKEAEGCAQNLVHLAGNKDESHTVEHLRHREDKDTVPLSDASVLNDTWIVRRGKGQTEIRVIAAHLMNLR